MVFGNEKTIEKSKVSELQECKYVEKKENYVRQQMMTIIENPNHDPGNAK